MKSEVIKIDNKGKGFKECVEVTRKQAQAQNLARKEVLQMEILANEMLSLASGVPGKMRASFWVENENKDFKLLMTTKTVMDSEDRYQLLLDSKGKNSTNNTGFLGALRSSFEQAMTFDRDDTFFELSEEKDLSAKFWDSQDPDWDGFERSVMLGIAKDIKITVRGSEVLMTVYYSGQ